MLNKKQNNDLVKRHKKVIERTIAKKTFDSIAEYWEFELDYNDPGTERISSIVIAAIEYGRLHFEYETEEFIYKLRNPLIVDENEGGKIEQVRIKQNTAGNVHRSFKRA